jgi:hypothetical protein
MRFRWRARLVAVLVGALMLLPMASFAQAAAPTTSSTSAAASGPGGFYGQVTWNGVNVATASSTSSAIGIQFSNTAHLYYNWTSLRLWNIDDARLQLFDFGFALETRDVTLSGSVAGLAGNIPLNWTPGTVQYAIEGVYKITASLVALNGSTVWSENFFVHATAPLSILAVFPIVLIAIAIYELYELAYVGRHAARGPKGPAPPTPPSTPTQGSSSDLTQPPSNGSSSTPSESPP